VPDVVVEAFEKLMAYVYKGEAVFSSMDIDLVVGLYYAGLLALLLFVLIFF
jgi:hypothetical protein